MDCDVRHPVLRERALDIVEITKLVEHRDRIADCNEVAVNARFSGNLGLKNPVYISAAYRSSTSRDCFRSGSPV